MQDSSFPNNSGGTGLPARARSWLSSVALWNWKSAILSIAYRVPVFAAVTMRRGIGAMSGAILAEIAVCACYGGFYAAIVQYIRNRRPLWLTAFIIAAVLPALGQLLEYEVHTWRSTPHTVLAVIISSILSILSSLFNWYVMRQGTFLVGREGSSFVSDLKRFPLLLLRFLLLAPRWLIHRMGRRDVLPSS
jgi:hypothetical protein